MIDRDAAIQFVENHRTQVLVGAATALIACMVALVIMLSVSGARADEARRKAEAMRRMALTEDELFMPGEPIGVSGVLLSRERKSSWTAEDAERWYTVPDASSMERLRSAANDRIDALLESVP